jgi:hypothetical protein
VNEGGDALKSEAERARRASQGALEAEGVGGLEDFSGPERSEFGGESGAPYMKDEETVDRRRPPEPG